MVLREVRIHGRGGQGGVTAAQLIAEAAYREGKYAVAFPHFGAERRGAPVAAFVRISDEPIYLRSQIYNPDYVIVLDPVLPRMVDVTHGLKDGGCVVINTAHSPEEVGLSGCRVATVDATSISLEVGLVVAGFPVVNTPMMGAFAGATGEVRLETILEVIRRKWPGPGGEKNVKAAQLAYERLKKWW